jgi:hypothetical protein
MPEEEPASSLVFLSPAEAEVYCDGPCVAIVRTREEIAQCLKKPAPGVEWLQVEGLIGDPEVWALAAQGKVAIPLDVILTEPATEFSALYRLVDVSQARAVRVTIPARPGLMKAVRLAASLQIPIRILPGQPDAETLDELNEAAQFYLHNPMVETSVEFFHSLLASFRWGGTGTLWAFVEQDPSGSSFLDSAGVPLKSADFLAANIARSHENESECSECRFHSVCAGYFKWPDPTYACAGVKELFATFEKAADEISRDLAAQEATI